VTAYRIGVDTGGTFTDFVAVDETGAHVHTLKVPSTPHDPAIAMAAGLRALSARGIDPAAVSLFSHGTTLAANALLEGRGAPIGLLVTRGFRGIYEVMDQTRGAGRSVYDLDFTKPVLLAPGRLTGELEERVDAAGRVLLPLNEEQAREVIRRLLDRGVAAIAVCLLFSFLNPRHERRVAELIRELAPRVHISLSSFVLPRIREYPRLSTTVVNAYVQPILSDYLDRVASHLDEHGVRTPRRYVMQSNGGVTSFAAAGRRPVTTVLSGPAAGAVAAGRIAAAAGYPQAISFDMGGTSADITLITGGRPTETFEGRVAGRDLAVPMLDIHTLSAGGGTIARVDAVGALHVGPESAGADPGPACYDRGGTRPTVTDANVALGILPSETRLGGMLPLRADLARRAIDEHVARPLGLGIEASAEAILRVVNARMEAGIRRVSVERGHDLRDFTMVSFGGAGSLHAAALCRELGIPRLLVPAYPGLTSAFGLLLCDVTRDFIRSRVGPLGPEVASDVAEAFAGLDAEAAEVMRQEGFLSWTPECRIDLRYAGQGYELPVPYTRGEDLAGVRRRFDALHEQRFGHSAPDARVEIVSYRLIAGVPAAMPPIGRRPPRHPARPHAEVALRLPEGGGVLSVPLYERHALALDQVLDGPALLVQPDTTIVLYPGQCARTDAAGNLIVDVRVDG
jgi:N-methylhydantoinase A